MSLLQLIRNKRAEILRLAALHGARNVRIFGSVARGQNQPDSDADFLVTFDKDRSLMDHAALLVELEQLLGCHVDVAPEDSLRPQIKDRVLRDAIPI
jgi:uncharacterized protein